MQQCIRVLCFLSSLLLLIAFGSAGSAQNQNQPPYKPTPIFCVNGGAALCPIIPGNIGDDPGLTRGVGYQGLINRIPASFNGDVQTPFDNLSWQTFVALNWAAKSTSALPEQGLQAGGVRVWQTWARPADVFKGTSVQANCTRISDEQVFSFASNGQGKEVAQHEEIIQAATGDPLIDIDGNWTIYERRLNTIEISYLQAPGGNKQWNLTTAAGQKAFLAALPAQKVNFPDFTASNPKTTGAIEIKAAWRVLDLKKHPEDAKRFYVTHALLAVAPDLVKPAGKLCAQVDLGLVAMHIIQKNVPLGNNLLASWFWTTFEHVDNAPLAANPCDVTKPTECKLGTVKTNPELQSCPPPPPGATAPDYSYFNKAVPQVVPPLAVNQPPTASPGGKFFWSRQQPFAANYLKSISGKKIGTQVARCWNIYETTGSLNTQWQAALANVGSVFSHYALISTQWGTTYETQMKLPLDAAPNLLSNTVVETYMQNAYDPNDGFGTGSCVSCHHVATFRKSTVSTDFSFLPSMVQPAQLRRAPLFQPAR